MASQAAETVAAHVVVEELEVPTLDPADARHLSSVLRLRPGEAVGVTDGAGGYRRCIYAGKGQLEPAGPIARRPPRTPLITVGFVPVKGDRPDWAVQKLAELGVDRIVLLSSDRSVVRWDGERLPSHLARLQRVARAAVMQSRQVWMPAVSGVLPVGEAFLATSGNVAGQSSSDATGTGVAVADLGGDPLNGPLHTVLVGPEGGWSDAERDLFSRGSVVSLGDSVLRAETAAVAAGVLMTAMRAGLVTSSGDP